jgi:hypothetical protein
MMQFRRYAPAPKQSTGALTAKLVALAAVATLAIGGLIATEMAAGEDPALGPKAAAQAKKASTSSATTGSASSPGSAYGIDPYTYPYPSSGSNGYSPGSSGYSTQHSSPPPVTSGTS